MNKARIIRIVVCMMTFVVVWNALEFLWCTVITKSPFAFEIAKPSGLGVITSIVFILMNKI